MDKIKLILNCSVPIDFLAKNLTDIRNATVKSVSTGTSKAVVFSAIIAIFIVIFINALLHHNCCKRNAVSLFNIGFFNKKTVLRIVALVVLCLSLPVIIILLGLALCYKVLCAVIISRGDKRFVGFLDSFDVFWSLEGEATINVLGVIESDSPETLAGRIRDKLQNVTSNSGIEKIFYRRNEEYGFYYWRRYNYIDVSQYVEILDFSDKPNLNMVDLEDIMSEVTYQSLPYDNEGLFKIFVTKQRVGNYYEEKGEYGIIFVIHHSVGDGVALLEFLCKTLADKSENDSESLFSFPEAKNYETPGALFEMIQKLCKVPLCFVDTILRQPDDNDLHGSHLLGTKSFKWTESDENLLLMVKEIKDNVEKLAFSDVLATALSGGMHDYYTKTKAHVPEQLAVILPVRFPKPTFFKDNARLLLKNDFSVTILDLPMKEKRNLFQIKYKCDELRNSADPLSNHFFIKLVSILPRQILQPLMYSNQATMVFSSMPGPANLTICEGNALKKLVFFVPHKGNTGLDVTALCYGGVLRFAASADKALISNPEHLSYILDGMVEEIKRLHTLHVRK